MSGPSRHLSWKELACHDGTAYPRKFIDDGTVFYLAETFEAVRRICGNYPIKVISAYRTPEWNRKIGGASKSQHVQGRALDLNPPTNLTIKQFYNLVKSNCKELGINGIGLYRTFIHIDIRHSDHLVSWSSTMRKESKV